jgi:hypothetical protein
LHSVGDTRVPKKRELKGVANFEKWR